MKSRFTTVTVIALVWLLTGSAQTWAAEPGYDDLIQQALQARNAGDFVRAEQLLEQARPQARDSNEVDFLLGMVQAFQERFLEAQQTIETALQRYPDDVSLQLARARILSYQGIYDQAITAADTVIASQPDNNDALNLRARIYYYQSRHRLSADDYNAVLARDPDNLEAVIGLYDVALARGDDEQADSWLDRAQALAPDHIDVRTRQQRLSTPVQRPHLLTLSSGLSDFNRSGISRWHDRAVDYRFTRDSGDEIILHGEHAHRFGSHDTLLEAGYRFARPGTVPIEIAAGYTGDDEFLPQRRLRLSALFNVMQASENIGATTLGVNLYHSRYRTGDVQRLSLDFTHYLLSANAWLTPGLGVVRDERGDRDLSWSLGAHWQASNRLRVGYDYTDAPETENSVTTQTWSQHVYGVYQLNDGLNLRLDYSNNERELSYTREALSLSLQFRF